MTLNELAQLLTVKAKGDTYKATAPNPKAEILAGHSRETVRIRRQGRR